MCFLRGGSSMRILNFCAREVSGRTDAGTEMRATHIQSGRVAVENTREIELLHLLLEARGQTRVHARAAGEHNMLVEFRADVDGSGLNRLEEHLGDPRLLDVDEMRLEHTLGCLEALRSDLDCPAIGELDAVGFKQVYKMEWDSRCNSQRAWLFLRTVGCQHPDRSYTRRQALGQSNGAKAHLPDVAQLLLYLAHGLKVGGAVERVATHEKEFDEVARDITSSDVEATGEMRKREAVVDGHDVRDAVTRVDDNAGGQTCT
jgi:hypothetical protein